MSNSRTLSILPGLSRSVIYDMVMTMIRVPLGTVIFLVASCTTLSADGRFYWPEKIPPEIPYQRAILIFQDKTETLLLQSKYQMSNSSTTGSIGWVVPVPSVPDLASMSAEEAEVVFAWLSLHCQPKVTRIGRTLVNGTVPFLLMLFVGSLIVLLLSLLSLSVPGMTRCKRYCTRLRKYATFGDCSIVTGNILFHSSHCEVSVLFANGLEPVLLVAYQ